MGEKEDYLTSYRVFFENFAATVNPEDQLPVNIAGYTITESELPGEVLYWITQYLTEKQCPLTLMTPLRRIILDEVRIASKKQPNDFGYKSDESVYIALRLMQAVTARVNDVCLRYLDNSRLDSLPPPPPLAQRDLKTVSCATKNSRRVMEDRHVEIGNLEALFSVESTEPTSFYAVYDGHAGSAAATYCAAHLHQYLVESPHFTTDLKRAMRDAFLRTDADFIRKSNQERACGGSTAVCVCVRARRLVAGWAGDSLALLAKRMRLMQLVRPHKPGRQDERDRIESAGGTVMFWGTWRVNGQLAVSRAIGDAQYKPYVTARPDIAAVDLDGEEDFVVVACDGLWDFVSEDDVALTVYRQLAADPDDLKAVTKRLVVLAKQQGSADNISIIVVFLKDPRDIVADNCPPMDLGLDNALVNAPSFAVDTEACKRHVDAAAAVDADADADVAENDAEAIVADNGLDNSDSDSEDLGPETAVDADDLDAEARNHEPAAPTPPADTVEEGHVDGALVDNVAESGEESEDEWNYFKGEGEREEHNPSEQDELPRSDTPCQDNSAWESSSVDMNSSPLNPDAPVFVPGSVAGADVLLAESPRKPMPMDDIELPDVAQFQTEAVVRPAELLDLDNCDQLNGHHNVSIDEVKEHFNGNNKCNMDSLGFGFNVEIESEKVKDTGLIQDFERIQKDTTDFCNIQVFQTHNETNPFTVEGNDELFERLKNKERDPMSMSFYQEKDDDTCERFTKNDSHVDLNAVQPLPDSDDEDIQSNGICELNDKENISPEQKHTDLFGIERDIQEPNNDIIRFDDRSDANVTHFSHGDNFVDSNIEFETCNIRQDSVLQTDTPESHKLLFEQIPEIPDGKSSELGFVNDDIQDPSESEKDIRVDTPQDEILQDIDMDNKIEDSPFIETHIETSHIEMKNHDVESVHLVETDEVLLEPVQNKETELNAGSALNLADQSAPSTEIPISPAPIEINKLEEATSPEPSHDIQENIIVDVHQHSETNSDIFAIDDKIEFSHKYEDRENETIEADIVLEEETALELPEIKLECDRLTPEVVDAERAPTESPLPLRSPLPTESPLPSESPVQKEPSLPAESPLPTESPLPNENLLPSETLLPGESPLPRESPLPSEALLPSESPIPSESPLPTESPLPRVSPLPSDTLQPEEASLFAVSPVPSEPAAVESPALEMLRSVSPLPAEVPLPRESPLPVESPAPLVCEVPVAAAPVEPETRARSPTPIHAEPQIEAEASLVETLHLEEPRVEAQIEVARVDSPVEAAVEALPVEEAPAEIQTEVALEAKAEAPQEPALQVPAVETALTAEAIAGPTPDIVPEERAEPRAELVTDIDIGIPESRAQEICVPVTSEIQLDEAVQPPSAATPPPTPAAPLAHSAAITAAAAAAGAAAVATTAAVAAAKTKTPAAKKSPPTPTAKPDSRTPKSAPRPSAIQKTPTAAATRRTASTTPVAAARPSPAASRPATARTSTTTAGARSTTAPTRAAPAARAPPAKPAAAPITKPTARPSPAAVKEAPAAARPAAPARSAPAARAAPKPAASSRLAAAPASKPAPRPVPAAARPAPRPVPTAVPAAPRPRPKAPEKKPLTNGDAKEPKPITKPAPRPAATSARPAPRAPAAPPATQPAKSAAPRPAPRTQPLDKQSKDLANKRITAKTAPPRTAAPKTGVAMKSVPKCVPKKSIESPKEIQTDRIGLSNGSAAARKAPPSPPAADSALPDVIA